MAGTVTLSDGRRYAVDGNSPYSSGMPSQPIFLGYAEGYGIDGYDSSTGTIKSPGSVAVPTYEAPTPYERGTYAAPVYDEQRVRDLAQTSSAAAVRGLRSSMQKISGGSYANPNIKRMTLRDALAGYGQGLQAAISSATDTARNLYNTEYASKVNENQLNFNAGEKAKEMNYETSRNAANMKYQGSLQKAQQEYQTMWNNYNAAQDRLLKQQLGNSGNRITVNPGSSWGSSTGSSAADAAFNNQFVGSYNDNGVTRYYDTFTGRSY